ncbi:MAG TPA: PAS domain S-box protein [Terriglobia bacterium]|nr:PAS domain S-box protein [Terriglobia bacterium]
MKDQDGSASSPTRRLRLLMIEDDVTDVELALHELKRAGLEVEVEVIQTPDELDECLDKASYDAVLSDYKLPGWTGLDAAVLLRKRKFYIPFILVSGILGDEAAVDCIKQGISDVVLKDHLSRLPLALDRALQEQEMRRARAWAENEVRQREKRFRALIENSSDGIALVGPDGRFLPSTPATGAALGWSPDDVQGCNLFEFVHPEDLSNAATVFADVLGDPSRAIPFQLRCRNHDGSWRWAEGVGRNLLADPSVQAVVIHYRDITERKEQESEIRRLNEGLERMVTERTAELETANKELERKIAEQKMAEEALANLQRNTELILNSAGDGILRVDLDGKCTFANAAAARILGYTQEEFVGRDLHSLGLDSFEAAAAAGPGSGCAVCGAPRHGVLRRENQMVRRKEGSLIPVDTSTTPIIERGEIAGAVLVLRDVSERQAMEKMKDDFVSVVSHELRTPLTAIRGSLGLLAGGDLAREPGPAGRMVEIAVSNADRLVRLVNDILDSARLESGSVVLAREPCMANELALQAAELMRPVAGSAGVQLEVDAQPVTFSANADSILQLLTNLLSNATKFSPPGSVVRLECRPDNGNILFRVIDHGLGIPADKLESIFGRFQPVDASESRRRGGTGLGLSICRSIARHHGGRIWAESDLGNGSTFVVSLPGEG